MSEIGYDECGCGFPRYSVSSPDKQRPSSPEQESNRVVVIDKKDQILHYEGKEFVPMKIHRGAINQEYVSPDSRMETFLNWPLSSVLKPELLVEAGFYYLGEKDICKCFYCDGCLAKWDPNDDPWVEHATHFPTCLYVYINKGEGFIEKAQANMLSREKESSKSVGQSEITNQSLNDLSQVGEESSSSEEITSLLTDKLSIKDSKDQEKENPVIHKSNENKSNPEPNLLCIICAGKEVAVVFYPCGHAVSCAQCAPALKTCVVCRKKIISMLRFHLLC